MEYKSFHLKVYIDTYNMGMDMGVVDNRYRWYSCGMCHTLVSMYINLYIYIYVYILHICLYRSHSNSGRGSNRGQGTGTLFFNSGRALNGGLISKSGRACQN